MKSTLSRRPALANGAISSRTEILGIPSGKLLGTINCPTEIKNAAIFSNGTHLVTCEEASVKLWRLDSFSLEKELIPQQGNFVFRNLLIDLAFTKIAVDVFEPLGDGNYLARKRIYNMKGELLCTVPAIGGWSACTFDTNGFHLFNVEEPGVVVKYLCATGVAVARSAVTKDELGQSVCVGPDGKSLGLFGYMWETKTVGGRKVSQISGTRLQVLNNSDMRTQFEWVLAGEMVTSMSFTNDGKLVYALDSHGSCTPYPMVEWDYHSGQRVGRIFAGHADQVSCTSPFLESDKLFFSMDYASRFLVWNLETKKVEHRLIPGNAVDFSISHDGTKAAFFTWFPLIQGHSL